MKAKNQKVTLTKADKEALDRFTICAEDTLREHELEWLIPAIKVIAQDQVVNSDKYLKELQGRKKEE